MSAKSEDSTVLSVSEIRCEVRIAADAARVWSILVGDVTAWWHETFYTNALGPAKGGFHIEPKLGGHMYEDWGAGQGLIWGSIVGVETNRMLMIMGDSSAEWGGPSRNCMTVTLEAEGDATLLKFNATNFGRVSAATNKSLEEGWQFLLEDCLKRYIETGSLDGAS